MVFHKLPKYYNLLNRHHNIFAHKQQNRGTQIWVGLKNFKFSIYLHMNCLQAPHYILYIREENFFEKSQRKKAQRTKSHSITHANFFMHILIYGGRQGNNSIPKFYPRFSSSKLLFRLIIGRYIN